VVDARQDLKQLLSPNFGSWRPKGPIRCFHDQIRPARLWNHPQRHLNLLGDHCLDRASLDHSLFCNAGASEASKA
jgi:hypothetical protein